MNNEIFEPKNLTISDIFSYNGRYEIPNYQRQYTWTTEHLERLWDDLYQTFENKTDRCYFLGSIVVVDKGKKGQEVVDGQQRITTLMIMLNVLLKTFPNLNKKLHELVYYDKTINKLKLQTDPNYNTIFTTNIINVNDYSTLKEPTKKELNSATPEFKYINTARFFYTKFMELYNKDPKELDKFVNFILLETNIIKIICYEQSFAIKLFLVLNDTGADLSASDIIKTKIYNEFEKNDKYDTNDKNTFNTNWKAIETICNDNDLKMDEFMTYFEYYKLRKNPTRQITDELGYIIENTEINSFVTELKEFADKVSAIFKSDNNIIYSLRYIPWQAYVISAIASAYQVNYPNMDRLLFVMRRFFYIAWISGKTLNGIKQTSFNLIDAIVSKKSIEEIEDMLNEFIYSNHLIRDTYQSLEDDVYGQNFLKPLMLSIEYKIRENINTTFYVADRNIHMDHILPKKYYTRANEWSNITDLEETLPYLNKLGNMALLLGKKNEEALNHGFDKKMLIYQGDDAGKSGKTSFNTTQLIIDEYNKAEENKKVWDIEHIETRQEYLIKEVEDMLDISRKSIEKNIVFDETNKNVYHKWSYNGVYYNNKEFIEKLLTDYIVKNDIKKYEDIPEELKQLMMHSHELIKDELSELDIQMGYSYRKIIINEIELYIRDYSDIDGTINFVNTLNKYFNFEFEYIGKIKETTRGIITQEMVEKVYQLSRKVYENKLEYQTAVDEMIKEGMNENSAAMYIDCFMKMMIGDVYKRATSILAADYYINKIREDYGKEYSKKASEALSKHINYLNSKGFSTSGLENVLNKQRQLDND